MVDELWYTIKIKYCEVGVENMYIAVNYSAVFLT